MSGDGAVELRIEMTRDDLEEEKVRVVDRLATDRVGATEIPVRIAGMGYRPPRRACRP